MYAYTARKTPASLWYANIYASIISLTHLVLNHRTWLRYTRSLNDQAIKGYIFISVLVAISMLLLSIHIRIAVRLRKILHLLQIALLHRYRLLM